MRQKNLTLRFLNYGGRKYSEGKTVLNSVMAEGTERKCLQAYLVQMAVR